MSSLHFFCNSVVKTIKIKKVFHEILVFFLAKLFKNDIKVKNKKEFNHFILIKYKKWKKI